MDKLMGLSVLLNSRWYYNKSNFFWIAKVKLAINNLTNEKYAMKIMEISALKRMKIYTSKNSDGSEFDSKSHWKLKSCVLWNLS